MKYKAYINGKIMDFTKQVNILKKNGVKGPYYINTSEERIYFHEVPDSKYKMGSHFKNIDELVRWVKEGKSIFFNEYVRNSSWVQNQQLHSIMIWFSSFRKTVRKD